MQVKFANGKLMDAVNIVGGDGYFQGASRKFIEFQFLKSTDFGVLEILTSNPENTKQIEITDGQETYLHENYVLRSEIGVKSIEVQKETSTSAAVTEERTFVVLYQKTYIETQLDELKKMISGR